MNSFTILVAVFNCIQWLYFEPLIIYQTLTSGFKITAFHGNFFLRSMDLLAVPNCDQDKVFTVQFALEDQQTTATTFCVQSALLYSSNKGLRQIRVHTLCVPVTGSMSELYRNADAGAMATLMGKMGIVNFFSLSFNDILISFAFFFPAHFSLFLQA